ncbi:hypothetical protein ANN_02923, partial [Periplaneta americana]
RLWQTVHEPRATLDPKAIKNCHYKLMNTRSVVDSRRDRPSTSRTEAAVQMMVPPPLILHSTSVPGLINIFQGVGWVVVVRMSGLHRFPISSHVTSSYGVYRTKPRSLDELEDCIRHVLTNVPQQFLLKSIKAISKRLHKLMENVGEYVEF